MTALRLWVLLGVSVILLAGAAAEIHADYEDDEEFFGHRVSEDPDDMFNFQYEALRNEDSNPTERNKGKRKATSRDSVGNCPKTECDFSQHLKNISELRKNIDECKQEKKSIEKKVRLMQGDSPKEDKHTVRALMPFIKHYVIYLKNLFEQETLLPGTSTSEYVVRMSLSEETRAVLESFGRPDQEAGSVQDVFATLEAMVKSVKVMDGEEVLMEEAQTTTLGWIKYNLTPHNILIVIFLMLLCLFVLRLRVLFSYSWLSLLWRSIITMFLISIPWNWWHLYMVQVAKRHRELLKDVPRQCVQDQQSFWDTITSVFSFTKDECTEHHIKMAVDPMWEVSPFMAIAVTFTKSVMEPAELVGKGISRFFKGALEDLPLHLQLPVGLLAAIIVLVVVFRLCGFNVHIFPFFRIEAAPHRGGGFIQQIAAADHDQQLQDRDRRIEALQAQNEQLEGVVQQRTEEKRTLMLAVEEMSQQQCIEAAQSPTLPAIASASCTKAAAVPVTLFPAEPTPSVDQPYQESEDEMLDRDEAITKESQESQKPAEPLVVGLPSSEVVQEPNKGKSSKGKAQNKPSTPSPTASKAASNDKSNKKGGKSRCVAKVGPQPRSPDADKDKNKDKDDGNDDSKPKMDDDCETPLMVVAPSRQTSTTSISSSSSSSSSSNTTLTPDTPVTMIRPQYEQGADARRQEESEEDMFTPLPPPRKKNKDHKVVMKGTLPRGDISPEQLREEQRREAQRREENRRGQAQEQPRHQPQEQPREENLQEPPQEPPQEHQEVRDRDTSQQQQQQPQTPPQQERSTSQPQQPQQPETQASQLEEDVLGLPPPSPVRQHHVPDTMAHSTDNYSERNISDPQLIHSSPLGNVDFVTGVRTMRDDMSFTSCESENYSEGSRELDHFSEGARELSPRLITPNFNPFAVNPSEAQRGPQEAGSLSSSWACVDGGSLEGGQGDAHLSVVEDSDDGIDVLDPPVVDDSREH